MRHTAELPRLSLIVLPFANLNADPAQDYLGDIITERIDDRVIAAARRDCHRRQQCVTLKGKPVDIKQLGADLDVRYALEGSVLRSEGSVRINARLVDTQTVKTLWSDQFDVDRAEFCGRRTKSSRAWRARFTVNWFRQRPGDRTTGAPNLDAEDLAMQCEAASYRHGGAGDAELRTMRAGAELSIPATFAH